MAASRRISASTVLSRRAARSRVNSLSARPNSTVCRAANCHVSQCCCQMCLADADGSEDDRGLAGVEESQRGQVTEQGAVIAQVVLCGPGVETHRRVESGFGRS